MIELYRHFDAKGRLLYVGISLNSLGRFKEHKVTSSWRADIARIEIAYFPTKRDALRAERKAIREESPIWNKTHAIRREKPQTPPPVFTSTLQRTAAKIIEAQGSLRAAATIIGINHAHLYRISRGERKNVNAVTAAKFGLIPAQTWRKL
jgi:hypothetical protein